MKKSMKNKLLALVCMGTTIAAGASVWNMTVTENKAAAATEGASAFACAGASIRLDSNTENDDKTGVRFRVKMDTATYQKLEQAGTEIKILVMPTDLLGDGVLDKTDTNAREETLTDWRDFVNDDGLTDANYKQAYAYVYGMTKAEYNRPTTWRAYYEKNDGTVEYSDQMERSLSQVALSLENDNEETPERIAMAGEYILTYNFTYDQGVRDTDGSWKTTTTQYRYGTELTELPTAPTLETREDFEFLAWETTKGEDKLKEDGEKTVITGNVTKEAYWLLTGEISLDSPEKVAEYADLTHQETNPNMDTEVVENPTNDGVSFISGLPVSTNIEYLRMDWKNIVVNTNLNCRFKGYVTSAKRATDQAMGKTKAYFGSETTPVIDVQNKEFDEFETKDVSTFETYGSEDGYYKLADFVLKGANAVHVGQTATFEKFQIGAAEVIDTVKSGNNAIYTDDTWAWKGSGTSGFNIVSSSGTNCYTDIKTTVSDSYLACTATKVGAGNKPVMRVMFNASAFEAGAKILVKIKTQSMVRMSVESDGFDKNNLLYVIGEGDDTVSTGAEFGTAIINVPNGMSKWWLYFAGAYGQTIDFVIESIEVKPNTITTDVPQYLSGANDGAQSVTLDNTGTVNQGVITGTDNVKYAFESESAWSGNAVTFNFKDIALNAGDTVYLKATGTAAADIQVNGDSAYTLESGATCDGTVFTANAAMTLSSLSFNVTDATSVDFTVYQLYIVRA